MRRGIGRLRVLWMWLFLAHVLFGARLLGFVWWLDLAVLALLVVLSAVGPRPTTGPPEHVGSPINGRWVAVNSPADQVPSHGVHAYGQTYAIDVAHPNPPGAPTTLGWSLRARPPASFSCFGEPVYAVRCGTVVNRRTWARDHLSRTSWPWVLYLMFVESLVRGLGGAGFLLGNHVVLDHGEGLYSAYAHLRRRSVLVGVGDRVRDGQVLGACGNSGNTSEPHLHFQLMDRANLNCAAGVPFRWDGIEVLAGVIDRTRVAKEVRRDVEHGLPAAGQVFEARVAAAVCR